MRKILSLLLIFTFLYSYTIQDAKKLKYAEQTEESVLKYKEILESLKDKGNLEAVYMLAQAYESGSHWKKDIDEAIEYYKLLLDKNYKYTNIKLGDIFRDKKEYAKAMKYYKKALKNSENRDMALKKLLILSLEMKNRKEIKKFYKECKKAKIALDDIIVNEIKSFGIDMDSLSKKMEEKTFEVSKDYIIMIFNTIKSSKSLIKNLGFKIVEYSINYSSDPTVSILLERDSFKIDEKMAEYLSEDNVLKKSIYNALVFVNRLEPFLNKEAKQKIKWIKFEVGTSSNIKIATEEIR